MSVIKKLLDNNLYFWLISLSFVLISYFSIYNSLILDNSNNSQIVEKIDSRIGLSVLKQGLSSKYLFLLATWVGTFVTGWGDAHIPEHTLCVCARGFVVIYVGIVQ